jgi:hypothetical protein
MIDVVGRRVSGAQFMRMILSCIFILTVNRLLRDVQNVTLSCTSGSA